MGYMGENRVCCLMVEDEQPPGGVVEVRGLPIEDPSLACLRRWLAGDDDSLAEWLDDREIPSLDAIVRRLDEWVAAHSCVDPPQSDANRTFRF